MTDQKTDRIMQHISVNPLSEHGLILQIKKQLKWMIASQELSEGDLLPSVRELAKHLKVNMHTVRLAYNRLAEEGLIASRPRARAIVLKYDPNCFANSQGRIRSHSIGIILPSLSNPFYQSILKGVHSITEVDNTLTFICNTYDDGSLAGRYFAQLVGNSVDGVISISHDMSRFVRSEENGHFMPLVSIDYPNPSGYSIEIDHQRCGFLATDHLINHGYQKIALVRYEVDDPSVINIQKGYEKAIKKAGLQIPAEGIVHVNGFERASGVVAAKKILALKDRPDAVLISADQLAIGAIQAFQQAGVNIPGDIAIASYNNIPEAGLVNPPITTVAAPTEQIGKTAMSLLIELISKRTPRDKHILYSDLALMVRQSCGCLNSF